VQPDPVSTIYTCAQALRDGGNPAEVAAMLDGLGDRMTRAVVREANAAVLGTPADQRVADLEVKIRDLYDCVNSIAARFDNLHAAMREVAKKESLHPSVRFICDTIALNLSAPTAPPAVDATRSEPPPGWSVSVMAFEDGTFWYCRATVKEPGFRAESKSDAVAAAWKWCEGQVKHG
jgi:hypothetical protein